MKKMIIILLLAVAATSCKKERYRNPEPCPTDLNVLNYVQRYYDDGTYYTENYTYDYNLRLAKSEHRNQAGALLSSLEYHYSNGLLTGVTLNSSAKKVAEHNYYYAGTGKPAKFEYLEYDTSNILKLVFEQLYEYNNQGQIIKTTVNHYNGFPSYYTTSSYSNGNLTGQKQYSLPGGALTTEFVYEYDNKANPYYRQVGPALDNARYYSKNNITRVANITAGSGAVTELVTEYEYRDNLWPVKSYYRYNSGTKTLGTVYFYK
ncbi:hypothetical protein [Mucilaginibacter sp. PAMB04168]|uniref:hypothetical protein n=1 Tax=Mucilaginibacter sp. PAMB04168 TaxID=3138567 RepID=UPI0031F64319